jgi:hypothetical protein
MYQAVVVKESSVALLDKRARNCVYSGKEENHPVQGIPSHGFDALKTKAYNEYGRNQLHNDTVDRISVAPFGLYLLQKKDFSLLN